MATHVSILGWKIPWMEEPGRLQSMGSQRVGLDWVTFTYFYGDLHLTLRWMTQALAGCILTCLLSNFLPFKSSVCNLQRFGNCVADLFVDGRLKSARLGSLGSQVLFKTVHLLPSVPCDLFPSILFPLSLNLSVFLFCSFCAPEIKDSQMTGLQDRSCPNPGAI